MRLPDSERHLFRDRLPNSTSLAWESADGTSVKKVALCGSFKDICDDIEDVSSGRRVLIVQSARHGKE